MTVGPPIMRRQLADRSGPAGPERRREDVRKKPAKSWTLKHKGESGWFLTLRSAKGWAEKQARDAKVGPITWHKHELGFTGWAFVPGSPATWLIIRK
jgi:hypothetical protein